MPLDASLASEDYCYVTTVGRVTGKPHRIEIWFGVEGDTVYLLAGGGRASDWVKNAMRQPAVRVEIANRSFDGRVRIVPSASDEDALARRLLLEKYAPGHSGDLDDWGRTALPVAIELREKR